MIQNFFFISAGISLIIMAFASLIYLAVSFFILAIAIRILKKSALVIYTADQIVSEVKNSWERIKNIINF